MPITINGSGTVTGISTGGLPDGCVATADVADGAINQAKRSEDLTQGTVLAWNWNGLTTNTVLDFTSIPSWVKRVTVMLNGLSTNGTSGLLLQLGTASGNENTGYTSTSYAQTNVLTTSTAGFALNPSAVAAADIRYGTLILNLLSGNTWMLSGIVSLGSGQASICSGSKSTASTLDRIRITTVGSPATDQFDAGTVNILYE